ncbi:hypothetical protein [Sphingobacterium paucimobilis]|uniref:Uncharacterized protein n=1 Tax=Sphingobacterium paucimobilis HER1398 TaxID=1346330 RepID=U2IZC7_9SPHI|nr:hypothetical protein [Sphingobacterium paucimobilis]ERJ58029.1 hypothetical protein M472_04555 [Sphingobacterium paucimobilis HER1398]
MKKLYIVMIVAFIMTTPIYGQQSSPLNRDAIEAQMQLYEHKIDAKIRELDLKEDNLELSKQNVADIISFHKEGMEEFHRTLNYLLVLMGIIVSVVIAAAGYYLERFNKRKSLELKKDIDALRQSMEESLEKIQKESDRELALIRAEAKRQMDHFKKD